jgi:tRNA pseudouridine synthase 10
MECKLVPNQPHWFLLHLEAQAGTYVKEFCHGDFGRTSPNVGSLLGGTQVEIHELDVTHIALDIFLEQDNPVAAGPAV